MLMICKNKNKIFTFRVKNDRIKMVIIMYGYNGLNLIEGNYMLAMGNIRSILNGVEEYLLGQTEDIKRNAHFNKRVYTKAIKNNRLEEKIALVRMIMAKLDEYMALDQLDKNFDKKMDALYKISGLATRPCKSNLAKKTKLKSEINELIQNLYSFNIKSYIGVDFGDASNMVYTVDEKEIKLKDLDNTRLDGVDTPAIDIKKTGLNELIRIYFNSTYINDDKITYSDMPDFNVLFDEKLSEEQKYAELLRTHTRAYDEIFWLISPVFELDGDAMGISALKENPDFLELKTQLLNIKSQLKDYISEVTNLAKTNLQISVIIGIKKMLHHLPNQDYEQLNFEAISEKALKRLSKEQLKQEKRVERCNFDPNLIKAANDIHTSLMNMLNSYVMFKNLENDSTKLQAEEIAKKGASLERIASLKESMGEERFNQMLDDLAKRDVDYLEEEHQGKTL